MDKLYDLDLSKYDFLADGSIYSKHFKRKLQGYTSKNGYTKVRLLMNGGKKGDFLLHRVLAYVFCDIPEHLKGIPLSKLEVDHIIPLSEGGTNEISNLRWCTSSENRRNEATMAKNKEKQHKKAVLCFKKDDGTLVGEYESTNQAARALNIGQGNIYNCACGRCKSYMGYIFSFA